MEQSIHESDERLELYALGRLSDSDVEVIEEHLLTCGTCCERLEETGEFAGSMREALRQQPLEARDPKASSWFAWLLQPRFAMAGAFAAVLLAVGLYWANGARVPDMATLQLTAMRGDMQTVNQAKQLDLSLTDAPSTGGPFQIELVNGSGIKIWSAAAPGGSSKLEAKVAQKLAPGDYFVRLYANSGKLLHEYGFHVDN